MATILVSRSKIKAHRPAPFHFRKPRPADLWQQSWVDDVSYGLTCTIDHSAPEVIDPALERLTLAEIIDREINRYRSWSSEVGDLLAGELQTVRREVELTHAETVAQLEDRREVMGMA